MSLRLIDHTAPTWPARLAALWAALGAPDNPELLPDYFVQTTFVKMGGRALELRDAAGELRGAGLLFPRAIAGGRTSFTLRLHRLGALPGDAELAAAAADLAGAAVRIYRPADGRSFPVSHGDQGGWDVGAPAADELPAIRAMHAAIWGAGAGSQYPDDLFSAEFGPATALVARGQGRLAGFLLGFHRFGGLEGLAAAGVDTRLSVESQVMGVDPGQRRAGLAALLKRAQARAALERGVGLIHWTADPLQFPNAVLNFHKLRALAGEFTPAYYPFQNELNRVPASRLGIAWLPGSARGEAGLADPPAPIDRGLERFPGCAILNDGPRPRAAPAGAPAVAIEIPADWTALQGEDVALAAAWRATTDAIFAAVVGFAPGSYVIADVALAGERRYLIGLPASGGLLA